MLNRLTKFKLSPTGCLVWTGALDKDGYARIADYGRGRRAHRAMYEEHFGKIPAGMVVMHSCDNPKCVNPSHLSIGTPADNLRDMRSKQRDVKVPGERNGMAILSEQDILAIRNDSRKQIDIAAAYGISQSHVSRLKARKKWGHLCV